MPREWNRLGCPGGWPVLSDGQREYNFVDLLIPSVMVSFWTAYPSWDWEALSYSSSGPTWKKVQGVGAGNADHIVSILSPGLFSIYLKLLAQVWTTDLKCKNMDVTQFYFTLLAILREAVETLNQCLETILEWMQANKLKLSQQDIRASSEQKVWPGI